MKKKTINIGENKGITLIALVITIIVLLILAGVTIATLTGDNGILTRTEQAKKATGEAGAKEKVQVEALGSFDRYGNFDMNMLKENLKTNLGLQNNDIKDNGDGSILVTVDGYKVKVDNMGNVTMVGDEEIIVELTDIYPTLYTDGTLAFSNNNEIISGKEVSKQYANIKGQIYSYDNNARKPTTPWYDDWEKIKTVIFTNEIVPSNLDWWFSNLVNLTSMDLSGLNAINVTSMVATFSSVGLIELDLSNLNTLNVKNMGGMFEGSQNLEKITFGGKFSTENVTDMSYMFNYCTSLKNLDVSSFNTSKVTNMLYMFANCTNVTSIDVTNLNTSKVINMSYMFNRCYKLTNLDLSNFDTSNVTDMSWMFLLDRSLTELDLSNFNTSNVINMEGMIADCENLVSLDVSSFDTSKVTNMSSMFEGLYKITNLNISNFNTSNVTNMSWMFWACLELETLDLSSFNTSKVTDMSYMFTNIDNYGDFNGTSKLKTIYVSEYNESTDTGWTTKLVENSKNMFTNCTNLVGGNGTKYDSAHVDKEYARIDKSDQTGYLTNK